MPQSILILGGGFDPAHRGHIEPPLFVQKTRNFDTLIYVPTGVSPHKRNKRTTPSEARKRILELSLEAYGGTGGAIVDPFEMNQTGVVYFYQTLEYLKDKYRDAKFSFLIGSDWISKLTKWRQYAWIRINSTPICMVRPGYDAKSIEAIEVVEVPEFHVSSTQLREKLTQGLYDDEIVTTSIVPAALNYIRENGLYRD